jgi:cytochrome oxidase Cu insertion factor (SCO1/SenC/PrrC family)
MRRLVAIVLFIAMGAGARAVGAQGPAAAPAAAPLDVGATAPDFALPGATRYGVLKDPVKLSDFKGKTVVLAFFFKARTRG